jgi:hypothetical protein
MDALVNVQGFQPNPELERPRLEAILAVARCNEKLAEALSYNRGGGSLTMTGCTIQYTKNVEKKKGKK